MKALALLGSRHGAITVMIALGLVVFIGFTSLAVDLGYLYVIRTQLQAAADASALAAAQEIPDSALTTAVAQEYAVLNEDSSVLVADDVDLGRWNGAAGVFTDGEEPFNAVRVRVRRSEENDNSVATWFARVLDINAADVEAEAVATSQSGGTGSRFLFDEDVIDSDIQVIRDLATRLGKTPEEIISDADGDWFIDLPAGEILELPTGQVGDEALYDITHHAFPFGTDSDPSFENFLNYNEDSNSWRYNELPKEMLDPLVGVTEVLDPALYPSYVNPSCAVSPVYKSDISAPLSPVNGNPAVNALGWRRGLVAYKILAVGTDPDGSGSVLPNLVFEICPPMPELLAEIEPGGGGGGGIRLVQ